MSQLSLDPRYAEEIKKVLEKYPQIEGAFVFGSRAMGSNNKTSDVDIALKGRQVSAKVLAEVLDELEEETMIPYFFDVVAYDSLSNPKLREHIDRVGVQI